MTTYRAVLPQNLLYDRDAIDHLLCLGGITIVYDVEMPTRASAIRLLGDEFDWRNMDREFWDKRLSGKRSQEEES